MWTLASVLFVIGIVLLAIGIVLYGLGISQSVQTAASSGCGSCPKNRSQNYPIQ